VNFNNEIISFEAKYLVKESILKVRQSLNLVRKICSVLGEEEEFKSL